MVAKTLEGAILVEPDDDETDRVLTFKFGTLSLPEQKETPKNSNEEENKQQKGNVFNANMERIQLQFNTFKARPNLDKVTTAASL